MLSSSAQRFLVTKGCGSEFVAFFKSVIIIWMGDQLTKSKKEGQFWTPEEISYPKLTLLAPFGHVLPKLQTVESWWKYSILSTGDNLRSLFFFGLWFFAYNFIISCSIEKINTSFDIYIKFAVQWWYYLPSKTRFKACYNV